MFPWPHAVASDERGYVSRNRDIMFQNNVMGEEDVGLPPTGYFYFLYRVPIRRNGWEQCLVGEVDCRFQAGGYWWAQDNGA